MEIRGRFEKERKNSPSFVFLTVISMSVPQLASLACFWLLEELLFLGQPVYQMNYRNCVSFRAKQYLKKSTSENSVF